MNNVVQVVAYGNFACFTMAEAKIDRVSYAIPTPSACRGILCAIYCKPKEFWYEITGIDVLKPIKYISVKKNEVGKKALMKKGEIKPLSVNDERTRTQRNTVYLRDVAYIITAKIMVRDSYMPEKPLCEKLGKIMHEFDKRVKKGKCFWQPYLGTRECMCFFREPNEKDVPIAETSDYGIMLYDIFDPSNAIPLDTSPKAKITCSPNPTYFNAVMKNGHITVPEYKSKEIFRVETE